MGTIQRVIYRPVNGMWLATLADTPGVEAMGVNLEQAEHNIRAAIAAHLGKGAKPAALRLRHQYGLPADILDLVMPASAFRPGGADQQTEQQAAVALVRTQHLTLRDAARVLGMSHTRVVQLLKEHDAADPNENRILFTCPACGRDFPHAVDLQLTPAGTIRQVPTEARCDHCGHTHTYLGDRIRVKDSTEA